MQPQLRKRGKRQKHLADTEEAAAEVARMELANRVFFRLYQCANMLHKTGTRAVESEGLTTQRWAVLGALSREEASDGMGVGELARYLLVSRQSLAGLLDRMARDGHLAVAQDASDLRARRVALTASGRKLWLARARPRIHAYYAQALDGFSIGDLSHTLHYLLKLLDNMERLDGREGEGAAPEGGEEAPASLRPSRRYARTRPR